MRRTATTRKTATAPTSSDTITGVISAVYFHNDELTIGRINIPGHAPINFRVPAVVMNGEQVTLVGAYTTHPKYGKQFNATSAITVMPIDMAGLEHYLSTSPRFNGIGPAKAKLLIATYGDTLPDVLANHPEQISATIHISLEQATEISANWGLSSGLNPLFTWLASFGLTQHQCRKIIESLGGTAKSQLTANPYLMMDVIDRFGFSVVDGIALKMGVAKECPQRIQRCILHVLAAHAGQGHTWMKQAAVYQECERLLFLDCKDPIYTIGMQLSLLVSTGKVALRDIADNAKEHNADFVFGLPHLYNYERAILDICRGDVSNYYLKPRAECPPDMYGMPSQGDLNEKQYDAYFAILNQPICIITGSAGTGKGYVIDRACTILECQCGQTILLAAPTGKAAKRMEEQSNNTRTASTLHRLLGYNPHDNSWAYNANNPLTADVVIVDEVSMLDSELAWRLFTAIDFTTTRLILAGDENQLPSVGPGNILHDLISSHLVPCVRLVEVMRQSGILERNATAILTASKIASTFDSVEMKVNPETGKSYTPDQSKVKLRPWTLVNMVETQEILDALCWLLTDRLPECGYTINDVQILTPQNKGPLGTLNINRYIQAAVHSLPEISTSIRTIYAGDRVMQTRNNYDRDLFNGTTGIVCEAQFGAVSIQWDGKEAPEHYKAGCEDLSDVQLAYATTVHKAQGSEYPVVIIIINRLHRFMNHRNLVYTAVTRASKSAIIIGDNIAIKSAMSKQDANQRDTWLGVLAKQSNQNKEI